MTEEMLGPQQRRVLLLVAWLSNEEIADYLGISLSTVRIKLKRLYKALHVPDLPNPRDKSLAAVVIALRSGVITFEELWREGIAMREEP